MQDYAPEGDIAERVRQTQEEMLGLGDKQPGTGETPADSDRTGRDDDDDFHDGTFLGRGR